MMKNTAQFILWLLAAMIGGILIVGIIKTIQDKPVNEIFGAPASNVLRNIMPEANDTYNIGSSTLSSFWKNIFVNQASTSAISITRTLFVGGTASTTGTATTTIVGANATSTFSGGIRLVGGCFELSTGSCAGGGVSTYLSLTDTQSSFSANRIIHTNSGATALTDTAGFVFTGTNFGIATATPGTLLSVSGAGSFYGTTTATSFVATSTLFVGGTSAYNFQVLQNGNVGIGATSSPDTLLSVVGASNFTATSTIESLRVSTTFLVGTSTLRALRSGSISIGATTTEEGVFSIQNTANFYSKSTSTIYTGLSTPLIRVTSGTASSTFEGGIVINGGLRLRLNCSGLTSNGSLTTNALGDVICDPDDGGGGAVTVNSGTALRPAYYSAASTIDAATNILMSNSPVAIGIATTSTRFGFVASSTVGQSAFIYSGEFDIGIVTTSPIGVDWRAGNPQRMTLGVSQVTVNFDNFPVGGAGNLVVCQDGSGGRDITSWDANVRWAGGATTTQSSGAGKCDMFQFRVTSGTTTPAIKFFGSALTNY